MNLKRYLPGFILTMVLFLSAPVYSQEEVILEDEKNAEPGRVTLNVGADLVSRYVWRGLDFGNSPAVQPTLSVDAFGFSLGAWGSYSFSRFTCQLDDTTSLDYNYSEVDLFLTYSYKCFTLILIDYFAPVPVDTLPGADYFNWNSATTAHTLEASLVIDGPEKFPVQFLAATLIYGADKGKDSAGTYGSGQANNYSTYFELSYPFEIKGFCIRPFIGGIPFGSGWYGPRGGINNVGINLRKEIPVSRKFTIPVQAGLVFNPLLKKAYLVFVLSL